MFWENCEFLSARGLPTLFLSIQRLITREGANRRIWGYITVIMK